MVLELQEELGGTNQHIDDLVLEELLEKWRALVIHVLFDDVGLQEDNALDGCDSVDIVLLRFQLVAAVPDNALEQVVPIVLAHRLQVNEALVPDRGVVVFQERLGKVDQLFLEGLEADLLGELRDEFRERQSVPPQFIADDIGKEGHHILQHALHADVRIEDMQVAQQHQPDIKNVVFEEQLDDRDDPGYGGLLFQRLADLADNLRQRGSHVVGLVLQQTIKNWQEGVGNDHNREVLADKGQLVQRDGPDFLLGVLQQLLKHAINFFLYSLLVVKAVNLSKSLRDSIANSPAGGLVFEALLDFGKNFVVCLFVVELIDKFVGRFYCHGFHAVHLI